MEDPVRVQGLINLIQCETETQPKAESHSLRMEDNDVPSPNWLLLGCFSRDWRLLRRETSYGLGHITTGSLTPEINLSQYARETKHLTLRDIESYLVPDG